MGITIRVLTHTGAHANTRKRAEDAFSACYQIKASGPFLV